MIAKQTVQASLGTNGMTCSSLADTHWATRRWCYSTCASQKKNTTKATLTRQKP